MSQMTFQCPRCQTQMKCQVPSGASQIQITCPSCQQAIRVGVGATAAPASAPTPTPASPRPSSPAADFSDLPPQPAAGPATFRSSPPPPRAAKKSKPRKKVSLAVPLTIVGVVALLGIIGGGWFLFRDQLPSISSIASITDSPRAIVDDFISAAKQTRSTIQSIDDESSRDAAIAKLKSIKQDCYEIMCRAAEFGPLETETYNSLVDRVNAQLGDKAKETERSAEEMKQRRALATGELIDEMMAVAFTLGDVQSAIRQAWAPLAEPKNEKEKLEYEILMMQRDVWVTAMTSRGNEASAVRKIDGASEELQQLLDSKLESLGSERLFSAGSPYFMKSFKLASGMFGQSPVSQEVSDAAARFAALKDGIRIHQMEAETSKRDEERRLARERASAKLREQREKAMAANPARPPSQPLGEASSNASSLELDPDLPDIAELKNRIKTYSSRNPGERTVIVVVSTTDPGILGPALRIALQRKLGLGRHFFQVYDNHALFMFQREGPVSDAASQLSMGKVLRANESTRTIRLQVDAIE